MNLIPEVIMRAAQLGIITLEEAEARIPQSHDWESIRRVAAIRALHPQADQLAIQAKLLDDLRHILNNGEREQFLLQLLPNVADSLLPQAINEAFRTSQRVTYLLFHLLLPRMNDALWEHLIGILTEGGQIDKARLKARNFILPYLPPSIAAQILPLKPHRPMAAPDSKIADKFQALLEASDDPHDYGHRREKDLALLIPRLNSQQQRQLLQFARTINGFQKHWQQIKLVTALYPYLEAELHQTAFNFVLEGVILARDEKALKQGDGEWDFHEFVKVVVDDLTLTDRKRLLDTIMAFKGANGRVNALLALVDYVDAETQEQLNQHMLDSVMQVRSGIPDFDDVSYQVGVLGDIIQIVPEKFLAKAVEVAQKFKSNREKSWVLGDIALRQQGADKLATLQLALDAALGSPPMMGRESFVPGDMSAFMRLVPQLTGELAAQAADRLPDYQPFGTDDWSRQFDRYYEEPKRQAMAALAANLPEAIVRKLLAAMSDSQ